MHFYTLNQLKKYNIFQAKKKNKKKNVGLIVALTLVDYSDIVSH